MTAASFALRDSARPLRPGFGRAGLTSAAGRKAPFDLVPDLSQDLFSARWWRGLATLLALVGTAAVLGMGPITIRSAVAGAPAAGDVRELAALAIAPGGVMGQRMAATERVRVIANAPERPDVRLSATLGERDGLTAMLSRAGVSADDAQAAERLIASVLPVENIAPGTRFAIHLGRRASVAVPRPLEGLDFRPRLDLRLAIRRNGGALTLAHSVVPVDATPLHIRGLVGDSLYISARSAGVPADLVQAYLRVLDGAMALGEVQRGDSFEIIAEQQRAPGGEVETGRLLYAGLLRDGQPRLRLIEWGEGSARRWVDPYADKQQQSGLLLPVAAPITSRFGYRMHPILGFMRFHSGIDFGAPWGTPIQAASDGVASYAGYRGGYGRYVRLAHGGGLATAYAHMSQIAVAPGQAVRRGEVIGYVGSSGLSTGPHLHYEMFQNGVRVDPASVQTVRTVTVTPEERAAMRARLEQLLASAPHS